MFCRECGSEIFGNAAFCSACGATTSVGAASIPSPVHEIVTPVQGAKTKEYHSYEYVHVTVKADLSQVTMDCYESLGFELTGQRPVSPGRQVTLSFRRSRKVPARAQLSKIQRTMDDTLSHITGLEAQKTKKATGQALTLGVLSALLLGVGMYCSMVWTNLMVLGVIVGIVGIAGCVFTWLRYRKTCETESARITPQIEDAYDRLATLCEEAQAVLEA